MSMRQRQRGMTMWGMLAVMMLVIGFALAGFRVAPIYLESLAVKSSIKSLVSDPESRKASTARLKMLLMRRLEVNDVESVKSANVQVKSVSGGKEIRVEYEARAPFVGNMDVVGQFNLAGIVPLR